MHDWGRTKGSRMTLSQQGTQENHTHFLSEEDSQLNAIQHRS